MFESRQFAIDRGLITYSLKIPFLPQRNIAFPAICVLSVIHCLKMLVGGHFSVAISPGGVTVGKAATLTGKFKSTSQRVFNHVFSVGAIHST